MSERQIGFAEVLEAIKVLDAESLARGLSPADPLVLVGGSAMAAHGLRPHSVDVDLYAAQVSDDAVMAAEEQLRKRYGDSFRLDVTTGENLWGSLLVRDIGSSPIVATLESSAGKRGVRALSVEDLFLIKVLADRPKDRLDLPLLAAALTIDGVVRRFGVIQPWLSNRSGVLGFADDVIRSLVTHLGANGRVLAETLACPEYVTRELIEAWSEP